MFKWLSSLVAIATLTSCASTSIDHFSAMSHDSAKIPKVYAWVVDDELTPQMNIDHRIFGVGVGVPYDSGGGIIGAITVSALVSAEEDSAYALMEPTMTALQNYDFEGNFRSALRNKILNSGLLPESKVIYEPSPNQYAQWQSGSVSIAAYQRFTQDLSTLWTGISVYRFDKTDKGQAVHRSAYLYEFRLPDSAGQSEEANANTWEENPALMAYLLDQGMSAAMDLMASDLKGNIVIEGKEKVKLDTGRLLGHVPEAYLISQSDDRIVVANTARSLVASLSVAAIEGGGSDQGRKTLSQIKQEAGIDDTAWEAKQKMTVADGSAPKADVYQYMGQAEEEITNQTYDKNLWARALVEAEGDEAKRRAKYIELRANQLYSQASGTRSDTVATVQPEAQTENENSISGIYRSELSGNFTKAFRRTNIKIKLVQDGDKISGSFVGANGYIDGVLDGNTVKYKALPPLGNWSVSGKWVFSDDFAKATGDAKLHVADGFWNLTRQSRAASIGRKETTAAPGIKIDGIYQAKVTGSGYYFQNPSKRSFQLRIKQDGNEIRASSKKHDLELEGVRKGDEIDFELVQVNSVSGLYGTFKGSWKVKQTGGSLSLSGQWKGDSHLGSGEFNLTKIRDL